MLRTRIIKKTTTLTLTDINDALSSDRKSTIDKILKEIYVNKCRYGEYIIEAKSTRIGEFNIQTNTLDAYVNVSIAFDITVLDITNNVLICEIKHIFVNGDCIACCMLDNNEIFAGVKINTGYGASKVNIEYKKGQKVPCICIKTYADINKDRITISAIPFIQGICEFDGFVIETIKQQSDICDELYQELIKEIDDKKKYNKKSIEFFHNLLQYDNKKIENEIDIKHILDEKDKTNLLISYNNNKIISHKNIDEKKYTIKKEIYENIMIIILNRLINFHHTINVLSNTYDSTDKINKYKHIWNVYKTYKPNN